MKKIDIPNNLEELKTRSLNECSKYFTPRQLKYHQLTPLEFVPLAKPVPVKDDVKVLIGYLANTCLDDADKIKGHVVEVYVFNDKEQDLYIDSQGVWTDDAASAIEVARQKTQEK